MLPDINLDNESYGEIIDKARNMIISLYPEWTDYNYHDPGITLLELFAWMKESQQYYLNQIGVEHQQKYLKLLGISRRHKAPAVTLSKLYVQENLFMMRGMKYYAGSICFEAVNRKYVITGDIAACFHGREEIIDYIDRSQLEFGHKLSFYPFGQQPEKGDICYIAFDNPLPQKQKLSISIKFFDEYAIRRNTMQGALYVPLAVIDYEYWSLAGWQKMEFVEDRTQGFLAGGFLFFTVVREMTPTTVYGQSGYFLRAVLKEHDYDVPPEITDISVNVDQLVQQSTLVESQEYEVSESDEYQLDSYLGVVGVTQVYLKIADCYQRWFDFEKEIHEEGGSGIIRFQAAALPPDTTAVLLVNLDSTKYPYQMVGEGNGFPNQELDLADQSLIYDSLQLLIQDEQHQDCFYQWEKVTDFGNSKPDSRHYMLDSKMGILKFGDCIYGMAPEGQILIISYVTTLGVGGNIKAGKINRLGLLGSKEIRITNIKDAKAGIDEESLEDSFLRGKQAIKNSDCAIADVDYENYVRKTPGLLIESCRAIPIDEMRKFFKRADEATLYLVVKPFRLGRAGKISDSYKQNIKHYLEQFRLLGTGINILQPEYIAVSFYAEVVLKPQYLYARETIETAVDRFFQSYKTEFGATISYSGLYGVIVRLDAVSAIPTITLEAKGNGVRYSTGGDIFLPPNGILLQTDVRYSFSMEE